MKLFHFCCRHSREKIQSSGWDLQPGLDGLIWLTDMYVPDRHALGLTSNYVTCNRIEFRMTVEAPDAIWWLDYPAPARVRHGLAAAPGAQPYRWWVAGDPIPVMVAEPVRFAS